MARSPRTRRAAPERRVAPSVPWAPGRIRTAGRRRAGSQRTPSGRFPGAEREAACHRACVRTRTPVSHRPCRCGGSRSSGRGAASGPPARRRGCRALPRQHQPAGIARRRCGRRLGQDGGAGQNDRPRRVGVPRRRRAAGQEPGIDEAVTPGSTDFIQGTASAAFAPPFASASPTATSGGPNGGPKPDSLLPAALERSQHHGGSCASTLKPSRAGCRRPIHPSPTRRAPACASMLDLARSRPEPIPAGGTPRLVAGRGRRAHPSTARGAEPGAEPAVGGRERGFEGRRGGVVWWRRKGVKVLIEPLGI